MTENQIFTRLKEVFIDHLELEDIDITLDSSLRDDLGASSIVLVELIIELEKQTNTIIELEELVDVVTVGDVIKLIQSKITD